jgi:NAD(P)-dependent dehydrogenase (short-subunit alcohol dehydrogenase family)
MAGSSVNELAIVVGATGALGRAMVPRLQNAGLEVMAVGRSLVDLKQLAQDFPGLTYCAADIASDDAIDRIGRAACQPVRMVVHSPGLPVAGGVLTAPIDALTAAVNIKVGGMLRLVRAIDDRLHHGSRLVAIGGHYGFEPTSYAATAGVANAALANLMRQLSWAMGDRGVTSHLIAPGPADTDRLRKVAQARADQAGTTMEAVFEELRGESAIHAFTTPDQVAWAVALLAAPEADALAGSTLMLDAGRRRGLP